MKVYFENQRDTGIHRVDDDPKQISNVCNTFISMISIEGVTDCIRLTDKSFVVM